MNILKVFFLILAVIALIMLAIVLMYFKAKDIFYKKGQVDAINGNIKYKLVEFEDGERQYYHVDELKDLAPHKIIS